MINVTIRGLDIYLAGEWNEKTHKKIASLFEVKPEEVVISALESYVYNNGIEQNSYQLVITVEAEEKYHVFQEKVAKYILASLADFGIHACVYFYYYKHENYYESINEEYPRFLKESNVVGATAGDDNEIELTEGEEDNQIYTGNIFEELDRTHPESKELNNHVDHNHECCCDDECDCDDGSHHHEEHVCHCHDCEDTKHRN